MYDELVKRIWECASGECFNCSQYTETTNASVCSKELMKQAANAIQELQAAEKKYLANISTLEAENQHLERERDWIPVTERNPKTDDIVIVAIHDDSGDTPYDVTNIGFYLDVFPIGIWVVENERCNYVTHWMPLPEPPKEE